MAKVKYSKSKKAYKKKVSRKKANRFVGMPSKYQKAAKEETKFFELVPVTNPGTALTDVGNIVYQSLNQVPVGTTSFTRIGKSITIKKIQGRMCLTIPAVNPPAIFWSDSYMIAIVLDTKTNQGNPPVSYLDVFAGAGIGYLNNLSNSKRFRVLKKFEGNFNSGYPIFTPSGTTVTTGKVDQSKMLKFNIKCNIPVNWNQNNVNGTLNDMTDNNIFIVGISKNGSVLISEDAGNTTCRIRYTDA